MNFHFPGPLCFMKVSALVHAPMRHSALLNVFYVACFIKVLLLIA
jgi:hypothetical protein